MLDLTVIILTKNEESNIEKCIKSVKEIASRIVVVDSFSTDSTKLVCKKLGVDFYENLFTSHANQFNWALSNVNVTTKWTMRMDADEELTIELIEELKEKLDSIKGNINGIVLKRRVYFMGKWIKHGGMYPQKLLRIWRTGFGTYEKKLMDEHIILKQGKSITLKYDFIDNNNKDLTWWTNKHNWYSDKETVDYFRLEEQISQEDVMTGEIFAGQAKNKRWIKNKVYYKTPLFSRALIYFLYRYIIRLGFLDHKEGLIFHFLQGFWYRFLVDAKIHEAKVLKK